MKIEYFHASKFDKGAEVAEEFRKGMAARGVAVTVRHIRDLDPRHCRRQTCTYVFSSPGRVGVPIRSMRGFLYKVALPAGTKYALLTTEAEKRQRVRPLMHEILHGKGLVATAEDNVLVTGAKGPSRRVGSRRSRTSRTVE